MGARRSQVSDRHADLYSPPQAGQRAVRENRGRMKIGRPQAQNRVRKSHTIRWAAAMDAATRTENRPVPGDTSTPNVMRKTSKEVTVTTDRYTKLMLTIIAGALIWLCVRDVVSVRVQARADQQTVSLSGIDERHPLEVKIVSIGRTRWTVKSGPFDTVENALPWEQIETR
jgi:hypothetical protein